MKETEFNWFSVQYGTLIQNELEMLDKYDGTNISSYNSDEYYNHEYKKLNDKQNKKHDAEIELKFMKKQYADNDLSSQDKRQNIRHNKRNKYAIYNCSIINENMRQAYEILERTKIYLSVLADYINKCIEILGKISYPTVPALTYDSSRNIICIYLQEYDKTILNATYNNIKLLYHKKIGNKMPLRFALFNNEITNINDDDIYMTIEPPIVDLHSLGLYEYTLQPLDYSEVMTTVTNPFPPVGFGVLPDYYNKLTPRLKKNWDYRIHFNKFDNAMNKINLEIVKINTYINGLNIKKDLMGRVTVKKIDCDDM